MQLTRLKQWAEARLHAHDQQTIYAINPTVGGQSISLAVALALFPIGLFVLTSLLLLTGLGLNPILGWVFVIMSAICALMAARHAGATPLTLMAAGIFIGCAGILSHFVIDTSYDGQQYHYDAISALAAGWNPLRTDFQPAAPMAGLVKQTLWPAHYPQAAWRASAVLVAAGLDMESAKLIALLLAGALAFGTVGLARRWGLSGGQAALTAIIVAGNPVILAQLLTRMNDGVLGSCIGLTLVFCALWAGQRTFYAALVFAGALAFAVNLKFSAIPLFMMLSALICLLTITATGWRRVIPLAGILSAAGFAGILILGAHPYVTNLIHDGHPFYPLMGQNPVDIMTHNRPPAFGAMNPAQRFFAALFSHTSTGLDPADYVLKLPFTLSVNEVLAAGQPDPRLSGFGPFFSGALLIALGVTAAILLNRHRTRPAAWLLLAAAGIAVVSWLMPESWWARYAPQFWWVPLLIGLAAVSDSRRLTRRAGIALMLVLLLNTGLIGLSTARFNLGRSGEIRAQLQQIKTSHAGVIVFPGEYHARLPLLSSVSNGPVTILGAPPAQCHPRLLALTGQGETALCLNTPE